MALKPETIARIQGILDGMIKVDTTPRPPADVSKLSDESRNRILALLDEPMPATPVVQPIIDEDEAIHMDEPDAQELSGADEIIKILAKNGHGDYSAFRKEIALDIYTNGHYAGHDTAYFVPQEYDGKSTLDGFYVIQEDHYDQHMDNDPEKPSWDSMEAEVMNGYLWMN